MTTETRTVHIQTPACVIANDPARTDEQKIRDLHAMAVDKMFRVFRLEAALEEVIRRLDDHDGCDAGDTVEEVRAFVVTALQEPPEEGENG